MASFEKVGIDKSILHGWVKAQMEKVTSEDAKEVLEALFEDFYLEEVDETQDGVPLFI
jgi:hypothetical protein